MRQFCRGAAAVWHIARSSAAAGLGGLWWQVSWLDGFGKNNWTFSDVVSGCWELFLFEEADAAKIENFEILNFCLRKFCSEIGPNGPERTANRTQMDPESIPNRPRMEKI